MDGSNLKGLYRRGLIYMQLDEWDKAKDDFDRALEIDPDNKEVKRQVSLLNKKIALQNKKDKKIFGGMFEKFAKADEEREKKLQEKDKLEDQKRKEQEAKSESKQNGTKTESMASAPATD
jgi:tetratricopeptide (TPR) repeat protein